ncbi:LysR substrate-binding domain-containing protein [uncultured Thalassospira sp.]|uniref:LysR family transcriptional regulator n=1 Tax=uncultured Thalassospira sp. TaxID=404382 RepID=UPI0030DC2928|tara:strand:- start:14123 stop:15103 length:981 start_codon:yes stop_codon:yes gene_type:complete
MEIRQLQCFVAVAEELHFRRAAVRLSISQPALSASLAALEADLGFALFFRTTRQVSLTQAGAVFLKDVRHILRSMDSAKRHAREVAHAAVPSIRVGGVDEAIVTLVPALMTQFRARYSDIHLQIHEVSSSGRNVQALEAHRADVVFIRENVHRDFVESRLLYRQRIMVALPVAVANETETETQTAGWRREIGPPGTFVTPDQLVRWPLIGFPRHARPLLHDLMMGSLAHIETPPEVTCEVIDKSTMLQLVHQGMGGALVPEWVQIIAPDGVMFRPYGDPALELPLYIAWRKRDYSPRLGEFIDLASKICAMRHRGNEGALPGDTSP